MKRQDRRRGDRRRNEAEERNEKEGCREEGRDGEEEVAYLVALLERNNRVITSLDLGVDLLGGTNEVIGVVNDGDGTCDFRWRREEEEGELTSIVIASDLGNSRGGDRTD